MGKYSSLIDKQPVVAKYSSLLDNFDKPQEDEEKTLVPAGAQPMPQSWITKSTGPGDRLTPDQQRLYGAADSFGMADLAQKYGLLPQKFEDDQGLQAKANRFTGQAAAYTGAAELGLGTAASRFTRFPKFLTPTAAGSLQDIGMATGQGIGQAIGSESGDKQELWGSVIGGFAYPALRAGGVGLTKRVFTGGAEDTADFYNRVEQWNRLGARPPSLGVVSPHARSIEANLESVPGTFGPFHKAAKEAHEILSTRAQELTSSLARRVEPIDAGRSIEQGLLGGRGNVGYITKFRNRARQLYDGLDAKLEGQAIDFKPFDEKIRSAKPAVKGFEGVYEELAKTNDERLLTLLDQLKSDSQISVGAGGLPARKKIPYQVLKDIRTRLGEMLTDSDFIMAGDRSRAAIKTARGIISEAIGEMATKAGAGREFAVANSFWTRHIDKVDKFASTLARHKGEPEELYYYAIAKSKKGPSRINQIRGALGEEQFNVVRGTFLKKMGLPDPQVPDNLGEGFNPIRFLRNLRGTDPAFRRAMFGGVKVELRGSKVSLNRAIDDLLDLSKQLEEASGVFANPSGTAGRGLNAAILYSAAVAAGGAATDAMTGSVPGVARGAFKSILALAGGALITRKAVEKLFTNQGFITWLAESRSLPAGRIPAHLARLTEIATDPETQVAVGEYLSMLDTINANLAQEQATKDGRYSPITGQMEKR